MMNDNDSLYRNLSILLKLFKNRPNHLAKYLIENSAFSDEFTSSIINSKKLDDMSQEDMHNYFMDEYNYNNIYLNDFEEMNNYYTDIIENNNIDINMIELSKELNMKLQKCIIDERYEEAAKVRDFMLKNDIIIDLTR